MAITIDINQLVCSDTIKAKLNNMKLFDHLENKDVLDKLESLEKEESEENSFIRKMKLASAMQLQSEHGLALAVGEDPEKAKCIKAGHKLLHSIKEDMKSLEMLDAFTGNLYKK